MVGVHGEVAVLAVTETDAAQRTAAAACWYGVYVDLLSLLT